MTTVNDIADILRIIREQPEWGDALRSALLSQELLELPQTIAEFVKATNQRLAALEEGQARLEERQARLESSVSRLEGAVGNLRGTAYEQKVANNIATIVRQPLGLRRVRLLKGFGATEPMAFHDLIDSAEDKGAITAQERVEAGSADIVVQGERHPGQAAILVTLEISVTTANSDINRAAHRSDILRRASGNESIGAVVSASIDAERQRYAEERSVTLISFGD